MKLYERYSIARSNLEKSKKALEEAEDKITEDYSINDCSYSGTKCFHLYQTFSLAKGYEEPPMVVKCHRLWENNVCMNLDCPSHLDLVKYTEVLKHNKDCIDEYNRIPKIQRVLFGLVKKLQRSK